VDLNDAADYLVNEARNLAMAAYRSSSGLGDRTCSAVVLAEGKSNKEVATALDISVKTAETHRATIMRKLEINSLAELVRYAVRNHLIEP
jgi:DNA-binding NarL/FixJ family response regulator